MRHLVLWVLIGVALVHAGDCDRTGLGDRRLLHDDEVEGVSVEGNSAGGKGGRGKGGGDGRNKEEGSKVEEVGGLEEEHGHEEEGHEHRENGDGKKGQGHKAHMHPEKRTENGVQDDVPLEQGVGIENEHLEEEHEHEHEHEELENQENHEEHEKEVDHDHDDYDQDDHEHDHHHGLEHLLHPDDETPEEHIFLKYGAEGRLIAEDIGFIFETLSNGEKEGDHEHDHHHGHGHGHDENKRTITPTDVIAMHGINGALDERGLLNACPMLLNCQLDDECELSSTLEADDEDDGSHIALKIIAAAVFFVEVIVGGMVPLIVGHFEKLATWLSLLNSFSGGIFMGAGFIHMLPEVQEAQETVEGLGHYPLGSVMVVAGFMLLFFVEHILFNVEQKIFGSPVSMSPPSQNPIKAVNDLARETKRGPKTLREIVEPIRGPVILLLAISVHSLFEALALGLENDQNDILLLFATIGSHKGVAAMALSARFVREEATRKQVIVFLGTFAIVAPLGILSGIWASGVPDMVLLILNGLAAGTFIYIGAYEVISDEFGHHGKEGATDKYVVHKYVAVLFGVFLMSVLQLIPHEH